MQRPSEEHIKLARSAYQWLRLSPVATLTTLFISYSILSPLFNQICTSIPTCRNLNIDGFTLVAAVLISGLWHLTLLQYVNRPESEFVQKHGRQALTYAGIRTVVALAASILSFIGEVGFALLCIAIFVIFILWLTQTNSGLAQIKREIGDEEEIPAAPQTASYTPDNSEVEMPGMDGGENKVAPLETASDKPEEILNEILDALKSADPEKSISAMARLRTLNFSSEAIRRALEILALQSEREDVRRNALAALDLPANRIVQKRITSNKVDRGTRYVLLKEIEEWVKGNLLDRQNADVIRRRYDFDFEPAPQPKPKPVPAPAPAPTPQARAETKVPEAEAAVPAERSVPAPKPAVPEGPRPSLLQTLTSEAAIKIYLYLGAFFVIAAATFVGWAIPELRLPILIIGTLIFGGLAVAIRKRLPQPSFALFIVFSFLLVITANNVASVFNLTQAVGAIYWTVVFLLMAGVWSGSVWLYESRLFSITAFASLTASLYNIGRIFYAQPEFYATMAGIAALAGLGGVWLLKKWKDAGFALPLFIAALLVQAGALFAAISIFGVNVFSPSNPPLWHLASFFTWGFAFAFFILADRLYPFFGFPWLAAGTLIPMPWFITAAFDLETLGSTIVLIAWSAIVAIASEVLHRLKAARKYSLPVLLASLPAFGLGIITAFNHAAWLWMLASLVIAVIYAGLHILRNRWWLWTISLLNFVFAYFGFLNLEVIAGLGFYFGYPLLLISLLFLIPDLLLKKDWQANPDWRLPPRIYGALFTVYTSLIVLSDIQAAHAAVIYGVLAIFFTAYALAYRQPLMGYIPAAYLPLAVFFALNAFQLDAWLPALTGLAAIYFLFGIVIRAKEGWSFTLRNSALILGSLVSIVALMLTKETGGWYALAVGVLFLAEMYLRRNGYFEFGAPILFSIGTFLILLDFEVQTEAWHLLAFSLVWLSMDLFAHLTFNHPRPASGFVRGIGTLIFLLNFAWLLTSSPASDAAILFGVYTVFLAAYALAYRNPLLGYIPAATLPLAILFTLNHFNVDAWLPALTGLAFAYFLAGLGIRAKEGWSFTLRNSALALGSVVSLAALLLEKETGGWYALAAGLLFIAEMYLRRNGYFELGAPILFTIGIFLILRDFNMERAAYHLLAYGIVWILADLLAHLTFAHPRPLSVLVRGIAGLLTIVNYLVFFTETDSIAALGFGIYTLLALTVNLVYRRPILSYALTVTLPLFVAFLFRSFGVVKWIHPVVFVAAAYYAGGFLLRAIKRLEGWEQPLLYSGLGLGVIVSVAVPTFGGADAALPVAVAATLWAAEAFAGRNVWLSFPANGLYLFAYIILLNRLNVTEPQFYTVGAALLGLIQHYLLTRAESRSGAFIMGMLSQFVLLGTTFFQMVAVVPVPVMFRYFVLLFFQSLAVLAYGIVIRSRSLTLFPIGFVVVGVIALSFMATGGLGTVFIVGCTGILLLGLGIAAVLMRERVAKLGERLGGWNP